MDDVLRIGIVGSFTVLALTLPTAIRVHSKDERRADSRLLALTVWAVFAAGIAAVIHRFGQPLYWDTTVLRLLTIGLGFAYVGRQYKRRGRGIKR